MGKNNNDKTRKKKTKAELVVKRTDNESKPQDEQRASQDSTQNYFSSVIQPQEKKRNWIDHVKLASEIATVLAVVISIVAVVYAANSAKSAAKTVEDNIKNFKLQNMPYLQIGDFKFSGDTLHYSLSNLNEYPAKIVSGKFGAWTSADDNILDVFYTDPINIKSEMKLPETAPEIIPLFDPTMLNVYVVKESPIKRFYERDFPMYAISKDSAYFFGRIDYINEVTKEPRKYQFTVRLRSNKHNLNVEFINNENIP